MDDITWTCHICSDERPDEKISVYPKPVLLPVSLGEAAPVTQNIRYCNDRADCINAAADKPPLDLRKNNR